MRKNLSFVIFTIIGLFIMVSCNDEYQSPPKPDAHMVFKNIYYYQQPVLQLQIREEFQNNSGKLFISVLNISHTTVDSALIQLDIFRTGSMYLENLLYSFKINLPMLPADSLSKETTFAIPNFSNLSDSNIICSLINIMPYANNPLASNYKGTFELFTTDSTSLYANDFISGNINADGSWLFYLKNDKYKTVKGLINSNDSSLTYGALIDQLNTAINFPDSTLIQQNGANKIKMNIVFESGAADNLKYLNINLQK